MVGENVHRVHAGCPECAVVYGRERVVRPKLHPIPVSWPLQIIGVDVMDLPVTTFGNKHILVFQDLFMKWPMVMPCRTRSLSVS